MLKGRVAAAVFSARRVQVEGSPPGGAEGKEAPLLKRPGGGSRGAAWRRQEQRADPPILESWF